MRVILVRPAETESNRDGHAQGLPDPPLSERGRLQAQRLAEHLHVYSVQAVYSSPLQRAMATARPIAMSFGLDPQVELKLIQPDAGHMEGPDGSDVWKFVESLSRRSGLEAAVCVSHRLAILSAVAAAIHLPVSKVGRLQQGVACYSILDFRNGRVQVYKLNENCHLLAS